MILNVFTLCHRFIEYGEYKNNYYGTSLDSVRSVLAKNKVCLLDVQPHVSKHIFWSLVVLRVPYSRFQKLNCS